MIKIQILSNSDIFSNGNVNWCSFIFKINIPNVAIALKKITYVHDIVCMVTQNWTIHTVEFRIRLKLSVIKQKLRKRNNN